MSWLETELREQPAALARLLERQGPHVAELAEAFHREDIRYVLIASRGTSSNAARYAQYVLGRAHRVPVMFATPSLYTIYEQPPRLDGGLVIGISQSGASPDVVSVLLEARRQGRPTIAMTNDPDSPLAMAAAAVLPLEAGEERAVAATKTYLNSLGAIALLFTALGDDAVARDELNRMPELLERQIALSFESAPPIEEYGAAIGATVVARGVNYGTAFEIALKIRELSGLARRGVLARRPDARADRGDPAGLAGDRRRADGSRPPERGGDRRAAARARRACDRRLGRGVRSRERAHEAAARARRARVAESAHGGHPRSGDGDAAGRSCAASTSTIPQACRRSRSRTDLPQQDEVLRGIAVRALGLQLHEREPLRERLAEIQLRVVRAAEIRPGDVGPAHDQLAALEALALVRRETRQVRLAVRRDEQVAAGPEHAPQLVPPRELEIRGQVREYGQRVDEVEALVVEDERRCEPVLLESRERQVPRGTSRPPAG